MHLRSCPLLVCLTLVWAPLSTISSQRLFILRDPQNLPCHVYKQSVWDTGKHWVMGQQARCPASKSPSRSGISCPAEQPGEPPRPPLQDRALCPRTARSPAEKPVRPQPLTRSSGRKLQCQEKRMPGLIPSF